MEKIIKKVTLLMPIYWHTYSFTFKLIYSLVSLTKWKLILKYSLVSALLDTYKKGVYSLVGVILYIYFIWIMVIGINAHNLDTIKILVYNMGNSVPTYIVLTLNFKKYLNPI